MVNLNFYPNELSRYTQVTYHFRLSVTSPGSIGKNNPPRVVLAETSNTTYYINDVTINQYPNFNPEHRNQGATQIDMEIIEPQGANFFDIVYGAAQFANVKNWMRAPFILDLWFLARDNTTGKVVQVPDRTWTYFLYLAKPQISIDERGAVYNFTFIPFEERGKLNDINVIDTDITVAANKIGTFFERLAEKLNTAETEKATQEENFIPVKNEYSFKFLSLNSKPEWVDKPVKEWSIKPPNTNKNSQRAIKYSEERNEDGEWVITVNKHTGIERVLENVLANTHEAAKAASGVKNIQEKGRGNKGLPWKYIAGIEPKVTYGSYVFDAEDYNKKIEFQIFLRKHTGYSVMKEEIEEVKNSGKQKEKLQRMNTDGSLLKRYDYIFTGMNTEVLNMDLSFDTLWYAPVSWYGGLYHYSTFSTGPKFNQKAEEAVEFNRRAKKLINKNRQLASTPGPGSELVAEGQRLEEERQELNEDFASNNSRGGSTFSLSQRQLDAAVSSEALREEREAQRQVAEQRFNSTFNQRNSNVIFADTLTASDVNEQRKILIGLDQYDYDPRRDFEQTTESDWTSGKSLFAISLHQAYGMNRDLSRIEIEIRGDPYWLGRTNQEKYANGFIANNTPNAPDYNYSEQAFVFKFGTPVSPHQSKEVRTNDFVTAVYNVVRVEHKFSEGQFTQTIDAYRNPMVNLLAIEGPLSSGGNSGVAGSVGRRNLR